jgi:hypothetical protein
MGVIWLNLDGSFMQIAIQQHDSAFLGDTAFSCDEQNGFCKTSISVHSSWSKQMLQNRQGNKIELAEVGFHLGYQSLAPPPSPPIYFQGWRVILIFEENSK